MVCSEGDLVTLTQLWCLTMSSLTATFTQLTFTPQIPVIFFNLSYYLSYTPNSLHCEPDLPRSSSGIMASVMQKLITPLASGPAEPPRNKVTIVGVGQVGMACAVSILLRVRDPHLYQKSVIFSFYSIEIKVWSHLPLLGVVSLAKSSH